MKITKKLITEIINIENPTLQDINVLYEYIFIGNKKIWNDNKLLNKAIIKYFKYKNIK